MVIGNNVKIYPNVYVGDNVKIDDNVIVFAGAKIYSETVIGKNCMIHSGAIIGADGFGYTPNKEGEFTRVPQTGNVVLEDNVDIGAGTTIDRATLGSTVLHRGVKLDNQIQIAHNVEIGEHTVIAAQTGIAGSTKIQMEEILPIGVSSSTGLAPEEVFKKKRGRDGFLVGEDELDQDDRTRRRRAKKTARRKNRQAKAADEKLVARLNPGLGNKYAKKKAVEMLSNARNVTTGTTTAASNFTNSASFFSDLSETVANPNAKRTRVQKKSGDSGSKHKL